MTARYERKLQEDTVDLASVLAIVRLHPRCFRPLYPPRWIHSVYYDTVSLETYTAHVNGSSRRSKVRLRWYGNQPGLCRPVLEFKRRRGDVGFKESYRVRPLSVEDCLRWSAVAQNLEDREVAERLAVLQPSLGVHYYRRYLETADHRYRLTIDTDLSFEDCGRRTYSHLRAFRDPDRIILELKYAVDDDEGAAAILNRLPFRVTRSSKYTHGIECLAGVSMS